MEWNLRREVSYFCRGKILSWSLWFKYSGIEFEMKAAFDRNGHHILDGSWKINVTRNSMEPEMRPGTGTVFVFSMFFYFWGTGTFVEIKNELLIISGMEDSKKNPFFLTEMELDWAFDWSGIGIDYLMEHDEKKTRT